jgi:hypothetical protein
VNVRLTGLAQVLRQQPYEAAIATAAILGFLEVVRGRGSGAAAAVLPHWALYLLGGSMSLGSALSVGGLLVAGLTLGDLRRVQARRVEQVGQYCLSGALFALGLSAATRGLDGAISGGIYLGLGVAAVVRARVIGSVFRTAGRLL